MRFIKLPLAVGGMAAFDEPEKADQTRSSELGQGGEDGFGHGVNHFKKRAAQGWESLGFARARDGSFEVQAGEYAVRVFVAELKRVLTEHLAGLSIAGSSQRLEVEAAPA